MTQPLALVLYERLLPGTQLVNRLQDSGYRVQAVHEPADLIATAEAAKPLLVFADLESTKAKIADLIAQLKANEATKHLPVVAFALEDHKDLQAAAEAAGAVLTSEAALLHHLAQVL